MNLAEAMTLRHSVRQYESKPIPSELINALNEEIEKCNSQGGLHIQLVINEPKAFDGIMAHYGKFSGVENYIALIGKKSDALLDEKCGYYGERIVLLAQALGLNTCWVALTFNKVKDAYQLAKGEKLLLVISLGYGKTQGVSHRSKKIDDVCSCQGEMPEWFRAGVEAMMIAPTALNQQKFTITLNGNEVSIKAGTGFYTKIDLGIVKCHFELGSGKEMFKM